MVRVKAGAKAGVRVDEILVVILVVSCEPIALVRQMWKRTTTTTTHWEEVVV